MTREQREAAVATRPEQHQADYRLRVEVLTSWGILHEQQARAWAGLRAFI